VELGVPTATLTRRHVPKGRRAPLTFLQLFESELFSNRWIIRWRRWRFVKVDPMPIRSPMYRLDEREPAHPPDQPNRVAYMLVRPLTEVAPTTSFPTTDPDAQRALFAVS
jgi:hypothetical protein